MPPARVGPRARAAFLAQEQQCAPGRAHAPPRPSLPRAFLLLGGDHRRCCLLVLFFFFLIVLSFMTKGIHAYFREFRRY